MRFVARSMTWLAALALVCAAAGARADTRDDSRAAFRRGVALAQSGDYARARDAFLEAYRLFAHPSILLNVGIARWKTGELVLAEQDLVKFLSDDGGASQEDVASARAALAAVRAKLGTVRVRVAPDGARATLDGQPVALVPGQLVDVRATTGEHELDVQAEGFAPKKERVVVGASEPRVVDVRLAPLDAREPSAGDGADARRAVGWSLVGTAAVGLGVGIFAGLRAESLAHDYNSAPAGAQDPHARADGLTMRTLADVAFLVGVASGAAGAYLVLTAAPSKRVSGVIGPNFAGVRGAF